MKRDGRILVIDDERVVCESCRKVLEREGFEVSTTTDGRHGLDTVRAEDFDAVIVDIRMPGTSGFDVLYGIKEQKPETAVVMITAYPSVGAAAESARLGAADYLVKPFTPDELCVKVRRALGAREEETTEDGRIEEPDSTVRDRAAAPPAEILIVGAWENADAVEQIARSEGCSVEMACNPDEVLEAVRKGEVEIVVLGMDVFQRHAHDLIPAVKEIRDDILIVVVSSDSSGGPGQDARSPRVLFHLVEPFGAQEVKAVIRGVAKKVPEFKNAIPRSRQLDVLRGPG